MRDLLRHGVLSRVGPGAIAYFLVTGVVGVSNFVFNAVVSRMIGPSAYGALGALMNLTFVLSVLLGGFQIVMVTVVAGRSESDGKLGLRWLTIRVGIVGVVLSLVLAVFAPFVRDYLHLASLAGPLWLAGWCLPAVVGGLFQGVLTGENRFGWIAFATFSGTVVGRLVVGVILVALGFGVNGAFAATVIAQILMVVLLVLALRGRFRRGGDGKGILRLRETILSTVALLGFWVLGSEDTVLARHFLGAHAAGAYAAASTAGRIALFATGAIAILALPRLSRTGSRSGEARSALRWALVVTAGLGFLAAATLVLIPKFVITVLYGGRFLSAIPELRILGLEAAQLGLISLLTYFQIARKSWMALAPWIGAVVGEVAISLLHGSGLVIAEVMLGSSFVVLVSMLVGTAKAVRKYPRTATLDQARELTSKGIREVGQSTSGITAHPIAAGNSSAFKRGESQSDLMEFRMWGAGRLA